MMLAGRKIPAALGTSVLVFLLLQLAQLGWAQKNFSVRHFDESYGLSSNFSEGISQGPTGHLIIANKGGLDRFDGRAFERLIPNGDTIPLDYVTCLDRTDDLIWFGLFDGRIGLYDGDIDIVETGIDGQIKFIFRDEREGIWAFSRSGMVFWANGADTSRFNMSERDMLINAVIPYKHKEFIIGSNDGLWLIRFEAGNDFQVLRRIEGLPETKITALRYETGKDVLWVGTEDAGLHRVFSPFTKDEHVKEFRLNDGESLDDVQAIYADRAGRTWFGTFGNGLVRVEFFSTEETSDFFVQRFEENLNEDYLIRDIFEDAEGNIWIATFGGGLVQIVENIYYQPFDENWLKKQSITQLFRDSKGYIWLGIDKGLFRTSEYSKQSKFEYYHVGGNEVTAICEDEQGNIWVGTTDEGLYIQRGGIGEFVNLQMGKGNLSNSVNSISNSENGVNVSTKAGLFLLSFNGKLLKYLSTIDGLPHNNVKFSYTDSVGHLWIACQGNRIAYLWENHIRFLESGSAQVIVDVNHILQDQQGRLWFATMGQGIFVLDNGTAHHVSSETGLPSDYCYQMVRDNDGFIWVSHQKSITQLSVDMKVSRVVGQEDISPVENSMVTFLFKDNEGNIWITSTHGVVKFNPAIDRNSKSIPQLSISGMKLYEQNQPMVADLRLPYNQYKVTFILAGISLRDPEAIRYKYLLKGYSEYWSESFSQNSIEIPKLEEGEYTLQVVASKNGGEWTVIPVEYKFSISAPYWRSWWFYLFVVIGLTAAVVVFVRYRTYRLMIDKAELEKVVSARTVEIQEQKSEIERSRDEIARYAKDITDSIKYAKRIQGAIFPAMEDVNEVLPEHFIFFQSKDLVSGDFYFAEKTGTKRIFCAVDCTGHGVPGGFMSIVANNLLKQAINQVGLTKPSEILEYLNLGVTNTLHQTYEESSVKDGMDIALCTWDEKTNVLQFAGAYNPLYLFRNGVLTEIKGNRFPVGTFVGEEIREFTNHEIQLHSGDIIYVFSDGFADQFGGPKGKKFTLKRFREMLTEVHKHPMDSQFQIIQKRLNNWMGNLEQIDDIVIIGVRIP